MVEQSDILSKLKDGFGLASKLAGKGVNEVSGMFKHEDGSRSPRSGVFWNRGNWSTTSGLEPQIDFFEPQVGIGFASSMMQRLTLSRAERLFGEACNCLTCVETETAINRLREAVQLDTQFTDAYFLLGCILLEFGNAAEAGSFFQKALLCQQGLGNKLKKYLPSFKAILPLTPWSSVALLPDLLGVNILLALAWRRSGNLTMAVSVLEQILSIMPTSALAKFFMGILRLESGQYTEVINLFTDCKVESTIEAACLLLSGKAHQKMGSFTILADLYDQALARADIDVVVRYDLLLSQSESRTFSPNSRAQVEAQIVKECPQYVDFFKRLGIKTEACNNITSASQANCNNSPVSGNGFSAISLEKLSSTEKKSPLQADNHPNSSNTVTDPAPTFVPPIQAVSVAEEGPRTVHMAPPEVQPVSSVSTKSVTISEADYLNLQLSLEALGKLYPLQSSVTVIGRESGDIVIGSDSSISYTHARIVKSPLNGHSFFEDLGSTNGSWLNGNRLVGNQKYELKRGDFLKLGQTDLKVV